MEIVAIFDTILERGLHLVLFFALLTILSLDITYAQESQSDTDSSTVETGFVGNGSEDLDYEALIKELYGSEEKKTDTVKTTVAAPVEQKRGPKQLGPPPGMFKNSRINGSHLAFNVSSPYAVADPLASWYSYLDFGVIYKFPYEIYVETLPLYLLLEVSTFSFENSYPEGGSFQGISYVMQASTIGENSGAAIGFGFWEGTLGSMLELNYRLRPTANSFFRLGTRGILLSDLDPLGPVWWLELRVSTGFEL
jgi:hypothetical protein